ncbi:hypothetical protein M2152_002701 [Microbacteriaceae bacterium SG_E_30_P1]|uniref:Integral membrane protein n=1 Tax=Antiquaquibacter oligotrophicus TaxID=2880260 RepID=A0ABT6KRB0_9MICO|nr:hypothetical protein [Antiquaquibacter oligotrophicus]MDH6182519.1 hypothetical protein [Antiquaquibacter oligotrophicus]UDF14511.1 hypothetical protein LH407_06525 [Antiquaquibacter oligotrophicus]
MSNDRQVDVKVRRAPKFGAFIVVGAGIAFIATLIVTAQFPADPNVGFGALVAYFSLFTIPAGILIAAVIALLVDRRSSRRARTVAAEEETVQSVELSELEQPGDTQSE